MRLFQARADAETVAPGPREAVDREQADHRRLMDAAGEIALACDVPSVPPPEGMSKGFQTSSPASRYFSQSGGGDPADCGGTRLCALAAMLCVGDRLWAHVKVQSAT